MPNLESKTSIDELRYKPNVLERLRINSSRKISNYFWKISETVAYKNRKIAELYEKVIGKEYKKEYKTFDILKHNKVLHIGCGAYPLTEIIFSNLSGKKVVGIDKNKKAVMSAREIIRKKNLDNKVTINYGNGINYPVDGFNVIIISSCSMPKEKILENIFKQARKNCIIIVRETNSALNYILNYINQHNDVTIVKKLHFKTIFLIPVFWNALYLTKKG